MKLNIEIDLSEIYAEYNGEEGYTLTELIKTELSSRIKDEAYKLFNKEAKEQFTNQIVRKIELDKELTIKQTIENLFKNKKLFKHTYNGELIEQTTEEKIEYDLKSRYLNSESQFNDLVRKNIESATSQITKELKDRYDLLFASQIVSKLNSQGMLREDVAKILLTDKNS